MMKTKINNKRLGIALSGGGTRGAFHCGFLDSISPLRNQIKAVAGTSVGAIIGAFYCGGYSGEEIINIFKEKSMFHLLGINLKNNGFIELKGLKSILEQKLPSNLSNLQIPLSVAVTNLDSDEAVIIEEGNLSEAVLASSAIPVLFNPVKINEVDYVDGGLLNNLPVNSLLGKVDKTIGIHINKYYFKDLDKDKNRIADKVFSLVIRQNVLQSKKHCDYFIEPDMEFVSVLDMNKIDMFFSLGKKYGEEFLSDPKTFSLRKTSKIERIKSLI